MPYNIVTIDYCDVTSFTLSIHTAVLAAVM